ncbi:MAG: GH3 auxin-responsive promoter family protein [Planctomycetota bacterium]|nr:GH3 auxin-responsive promoter family protein [Planctomycetota bacterium]
MSDLEALVRTGVRKRVAAMRDLDARVGLLQREKLLGIVERNKETEFGRAHGFRRIKSPEDYAAAVPLSTAPDYHAAWKRIENGERNVLFADPVYAFALSSGTTGEPKKVPLTKALVRALKRASGYTTSAYMARTGNFSLLRGYALQVAAPTVVEHTRDGKPVGYITGIIGGGHSYPLHNIAIPEPAVLNILDWAEKYTVILQRYGDFDVRMIFGVASYILGFLRFVMQQRGLKDIRGIWPHLELVVTSGVPLGRHRPMAARICPDAEFVEVYLSTEAAIACQVEPSPAGMMPMAEDLFFEFVREEEWEQPGARRLGLTEVEADVPYVLAITTASGLYAYSLGDVVRFVSVDPPRMEIQGRLGSVLNLATEKLDAKQAESVLEKTGYEFEGFTVCPAADGACAHEWVVEFRGAVPENATERLDSELRKANPLYSHMREGGLLMGAPVVTPVREGTFAAALRRRAGQGKVLAIYQDRKVRDELVELSQEQA